MVSVAFVHPIEGFYVKKLIKTMSPNVCLLSLGNAPGNFDTVIHNHSLKEAYQELRDFIVTSLETQRDEGINVHLKHVQMNDDEDWN